MAGPVRPAARELSDGRLVGQALRRAWLLGVKFRSMTVFDRLVTSSRELMEMADVARRSSMRAIAESHALVKVAHSIRHTSRQLRERSLLRASRMPKGAGAPRGG